MARKMAMLMASSAMVAVAGFVATVACCGKLCCGKPMASADDGLGPTGSCERQVLQ
jgi:hypothetical protein